jgi:WD40 repeat protein
VVHDVFISHSSKDKAIADAMTAKLESAGIRCWVAPRDVPPGHNWGEAIIDAITECKVMVLIYSGNSNVSPQVQREVERAVNKGLHIIPFRTEAAPLSKAMEYFISAPHWLDALDDPLEKHLNRLVELVRQIVPPAATAIAAGRLDARAESPATTRATPPAALPVRPPRTLKRLAIAIAVAAFGVIVGMVIWNRVHAVTPSAAWQSTGIVVVAPGDLSRISVPATQSSVNNAAPVEAPVRIDEQGHRVVNLMALIDLDRDVRGKWLRKKTALMSMDPKSDLIIPFECPTEYDLRISLSSADVEVFWLVKEKRLDWRINNKFIGFDTKANPCPDHDEQSVGLASTWRRMDASSGDRHDCVIRIRKDSVGTSLDGKELLTYATDFNNMETGRDCPLRRDDSRLAIRCWRSTILESIEVVEITGRGIPGTHAVDGPELVRVLKPKDPPRTVAFTAGGRAVLCLCGNSDSAWAWDATTGSSLISGSGSWAVGMPDGRHCIVNRTGTNVQDPMRYLDLATGDAADLLMTPPLILIGPQLSPDGRMLAATVSDHDPSPPPNHGMFMLFDSSSLPELKEIRHFNVTGVESAVFASDGSRLFSARMPMTRCHDTRDGTEIWHAATNERGHKLLRIDHSGAQILTVSIGEDALVHETASGKMIARFQNLDHLSDALFTVDGKFVITATNGKIGNLQLWSIAGGKELHRFQEIGPVDAIVLSKNGRWLLAGCEDATVRLIDTETGKQLHTFVGHDRAVNSVAFSPDETMFASGSTADGSVRLWRLPAPSATQPVP